MRYVGLAAAMLLLSSCMGGRYEPGGSLSDPLCMPDGSVVFYEYANKDGKFDEVRANKQNCPWNQPKKS